jgi:gamma-glutamyltranspeptidase
MVPTIVEHEDGSLAVVGGSGGGRIFGAIFQTLLNLDWGLDAREAVEYWRVHTQLLPEIVDADEGYPAHILAGLLERGHQLSCAQARILKCHHRLFFYFSDAACRSRGAAHRAEAGRTNFRWAHLNIVPLPLSDFSSCE